MKPIIYTLFLTLMLIICISCDKETENISTVDNHSELVIRTGVNQMSNMLKSGPVSDFQENNKLGLFITKGNLGDDYSSSVSRNVLSTLTGGIWKQSPSVNLYADNATVFAYYPYYNSNTNGSEIPVQSGLIDYMYGTHTSGQGAINKDNRTVNLTMSHALSLIQFNIYKVSYPWEGRLNLVRINNAPDKTVVYYSGKLNIQTGEITDQAGTNRNIQINSSPLLMIPDDRYTDEKDYVKLLLIPTSQTSSRGEVIITFEIDGKEFSWEVPAGTEWKQGTKNTYDVQLNGNELRIGQVKIVDWIDGAGGNTFLE